MKVLTLSALYAFTILTAAAPSLSGNDCGRCDTYPSGRLGGNAIIPLRTSADPDKGKAYKCTTLGKEVRLDTCFNNNCGLCMVFK